MDNSIWYGGHLTSYRKGKVHDQYWLGQERSSDPPVLFTNASAASNRARELNLWGYVVEVRQIKLSVL